MLLQPAIVLQAMEGQFSHLLAHGSDLTPLQRRTTDAPWRGAAPGRARLVGALRVWFGAGRRWQERRHLAAPTRKVSAYPWRRCAVPDGVNSLRIGVNSNLKKGVARPVEDLLPGHREVTSTTRRAYSREVPFLAAELSPRPRGRKRANGEGSVYQRSDGLWVAAITGANGSRQRLYARFRAEAGRRLTEALHRRDQGMGDAAPAGRDTVATYLMPWLDGLGGSVKPARGEKYRRDITLHVLPHVGRLPPPRLTPPRLQRLYGDLAEEGLSAMSIRHVHAVAHKALKQGVRWGKVARNVVDLVDPPQAPRHEMQTLHWNKCGPCSGPWRTIGWGHCTPSR